MINGRDYGSIRVSEATRRRVWDAVRDLGYIPNLAARNLARGSNRLIGVFTYEPLFPLESRDFYHEFLVGIEEAAEAADYNLLLVTGTRGTDRKRSIYGGGVNNLQLADGSILIGTHEDPDEITRLAHENYPFVYIGRREFPGVTPSYVTADYDAGTQKITKEIIGRGHRRLALVGPPIPTRAGGRREGFRQAINEHRPLGVEGVVVALGSELDVVEPCDAAFTRPDQLMAWLLAHNVTAAIMENDYLAVTIREAADQAGIGVPAALSLIGLGGASDLSANSDLTRLHIPRREMGQEAVRVLLRLLTEKDHEPISSVLPCGILPGQTLGPPVGPR